MNLNLTTKSVAMCSSYTAQPGANGGAGATDPDNQKQYVHLKVLGETTPSQNGGFGQRPGSQGQPQGTGSRGSIFASLGETEPPPLLGKDISIRLPSITGGNL